jgi:phospholipid/cholesterol/gamma-HCH transport system substrate-binding protein
MARHNPAEIVTGAVVLAAAGAFLLFAVANTGKSFGASGYSLHASFDHADGIAPGIDVRMAGVKIGSIEAVSLDPKTYQADVTFSVQNDIKLTDDSSATVSTDGLLGGKYLALAVGGDDKILKAGDAITITQGSMNLEGLISKYIFPSVGGKGGGGKGGSGGAGNSGQAASSGGGIAPLK